MIPVFSRDAEMTETDVKQGLSRPELWERIRVAELPGATARTINNWFVVQSKHESFAERLKSAHDLTAESARRLETEYRRYLYLKAFDGGILTPSKWVDRAWHLHLDTEGGAWDAFCKDVLEYPVEHKTGLPSADAKASYTRTLDLYRREFKEEPSVDIWPSLAYQQSSAMAGKLAGYGLGFFFLGVLGYTIGIYLPDFIETSSKSAASRFFLIEKIMNINFIFFYFVKILGALSMFIGILLLISGAIIYPHGKVLEQEANCG
jgi:hypothetical protein